MSIVVDFWAEPAYAELLLDMQKRIHDYVVADKGTAKEALDLLVSGLDQGLQGRRQDRLRRGCAHPAGAPRRTAAGRPAGMTQSRETMDEVTETSLAARVARATPIAIARPVRGLSDRAVAWLFIAPTILLLLAINIFPLIWTIRLSFTNYRANRPNVPLRWLGLDHYSDILPTPISGRQCRSRHISSSATIVIETLPGLRPRLSDRPQVSRTCLLDHRHPDPDDAVARRGG